MRPQDATPNTHDLRRTARLFSLILALAVTALFSLVPFKSPRVMFFPPQIASETHAQKSPTLDTAPRQSEYKDTAVLGTVDGRQDLSPHWTPLLSAAPLYAGVRSHAGLCPWRARQVALPPAVHFRLRAPPSLG